MRFLHTLCSPFVCRGAELAEFAGLAEPRVKAALPVLAEAIWLPLEGRGVRHSMDVLSLSAWAAGVAGEAA